MKQVYIVHGYTASPDSHWFPALERALQRQGIACQRLAMPNSSEPDAQQWFEHLKCHITLTPNTVVIGHSLGCVTLLNYLCAMQQKIRGGVFVSGFYQSLPNLPELNGFSQLFAQTHAQNANLALFQQCPWVISAQDDSVVAHPFSDALAQLLHANYTRLNQGGHFLGREGWLDFPFVLERVLKMFNE